MDIISKTKYLEFKKTLSPSGNDWHYVKRTNDTAGFDSAVVITTVVKFDNEYKFLFLKTRRPPIFAENKALYCIESPSGLIKDEKKDESLIDCINKELLEETGLKADKTYIELTNSCSSSGLSSETLTYATVICKEYAVADNPQSDGGIITDRFFVNTDKIYDFISNNNNNEMSIASATLAGIFFALKRI